MGGLGCFGWLVDWLTRSVGVDSRWLGAWV